MAKSADKTKVQEQVLVLRIDMSEALAKLDEEIRRRSEQLEKMSEALAKLDEEIRRRIQALEKGGR